MDFERHLQRMYSFEDGASSNDNHSVSGSYAILMNSSPFFFRTPRPSDRCCASPFSFRARSVRLSVWRMRMTLRIFGSVRVFFAPWPRAPGRKENPVIRTDCGRVLNNASGNAWPQWNSAELSLWRCEGCVWQGACGAGLVSVRGTS